MQKSNPPNRGCMFKHNMVNIRMFVHIENIFGQI